MNNVSKKYIFSTITALIGICIFLNAFYFNLVGKKLNIGNLWLQSRIQKAANYLPAITRQSEPIILVIGASDIEAIYKPSYVDNLLKAKNITASSYNFGFRNINIIINDLSERISNEFLKGSRKSDLTVVKIMPSNLTKTARKSTIDIILGDTSSSTLYQLPAIFKKFKEKPDRLMQALLKTYFYGGLSCYSATALVSWQLFNSVPDWWPFEKPSDKTPATKAMIDFWNSEELHTEPAWDETTRGYFHWGLPKTEKTFNQFLTLFKETDVIKASAEYHQRRHDILNLDFDKQLVQNFINALLQLKEVSKNIVVLYYPESSSIVRTDDAKKRLDDLLVDIKSSTDVSILDYSKMKIFNDDDYFDDMHLTDAGGVKLMNQMAKDFAVILENNK